MSSPRPEEKANAPEDYEELLPGVNRDDDFNGKSRIVVRTAIHSHSEVIAFS